MRPTPHVSVVIATYNGAARVPDVLAALAAQTAPDGSFEVIVVDNNSTDGTAAAVEDDPATAALRARGVEVRVVTEPRQGSGFARIQGAIQSNFALICFLDDDNLPEINFLQTGISLFKKNDVGLAVSCVRPKWITEPPPSINRRRHLFAINDFMGDSVADFGAKASIEPIITAGLWITREAFFKSIPWDKPEALLPGRVGSSLGGNEDTEIGILVGKAGFRRIYYPNLVIEHLIPASRLETLYVCQLIEGVVRSELSLQSKYGNQLKAKQRFFAVVQLLAAPIVAFWRGDFVRETAFVSAAAVARLKGPFPEKK